jgi:hypothetical protein
LINFIVERVVVSIGIVVFDSIVAGIKDGLVLGSLFRFIYVLFGLSILFHAGLLSASVTGNRCIDRAGEFAVKKIGQWSKTSEWRKSCTA